MNASALGAKIGLTSKADSSISQKKTVQIYFFWVSSDIEIKLTVYLICKICESLVVWIRTKDQIGATESHFNVI